MTSGHRFLLQAALSSCLLGIGFFGGYRYFKQRDQGPRQLAECQKQSKEVRELQRRTLVRDLLMEAEVGLLRGNPSFAFERLSRGQVVAQQFSEQAGDLIDELLSQLMTQDPAAKDKLLELADRVLPLPMSRDLPMPKGKQAQGAPAKAAPAAPAAQAPAAAPAAPAAAPAPAAGEPVPGAYDALLDAKTALLSGDAAGAVPKIARARVLLDEAGRGELDKQVDAVIADARRRDQAKTLSGLDAILKLLRPQR